MVILNESIPLTASRVVIGMTWRCAYGLCWCELHTHSEVHSLVTDRASTLEGQCHGTEQPDSQHGLQL